MGTADRRRQREIARQLNPWTRRRVAAWSLFVLALVVAGQHVVAHLGWRPIPLGMGWQDLLLGYPMAGALAVAAAIVAEPRSR